MPDPTQLQQPPQVEDFLAIAHEDEQQRGLIRKRSASAAHGTNVVPTRTRFAPTYTTECRRRRPSNPNVTTESPRVEPGAPNPGVGKQFDTGSDRSSDSSGPRSVEVSCRT